MKEIDEFIAQVRAKLNRHQSLRILIWSLAIGAAALLFIALTYIVRGHAVPTFWYPFAIVGTLAGAAITAIIRRSDMDKS